MPSGRRARKKRNRPPLHPCHTVHHRAATHDPIRAMTRKRAGRHSSQPSTSIFSVSGSVRWRNQPIRLSNRVIRPSWVSFKKQIDAAGISPRIRGGMACEIKRDPTGTGDCASSKQPGILSWSFRLNAVPVMSDPGTRRCQARPPRLLTQPIPAMPAPRIASGAGSGTATKLPWLTVTSAITGQTPSLLTGSRSTCVWFAKSAGIVSVVKAEFSPCG